MPRTRPAPSNPPPPAGRPEPHRRRCRHPRAGNDHAPATIIIVLELARFRVLVSEAPPSASKAPWQGPGRGREGAVPAHSTQRGTRAALRGAHQHLERLPCRHDVVAAAASPYAQTAAAAAAAVDAQGVSTVDRGGRHLCALSRATARGPRAVAGSRRLARRERWLRPSLGEVAPG